MFSSSLLCYMLFSSALPLQARINQRPSNTKTEISFQICKHQCWLHEASSHGSAQISCNHKMWQVRNHPLKPPSVNIIKLATSGNMHLWLVMCVQFLYQWLMMWFEADHFAVNYWTSFIAPYCFDESALPQVKSLVYSQRYFCMPPEKLLRETLHYFSWLSNITIIFQGSCIAIGFAGKRKDCVDCNEWCTGPSLKVSLWLMASV